jgi:hypothetical protein
MKNPFRGSEFPISRSQFPITLQREFRPKYLPRRDISSQNRRQTAQNVEIPD